MAELSISQAELARRAGVSPGAIQQILNGSTLKSKAAPDIADALDVSLRWLQGQTDEPDHVFLPLETVRSTVPIPFIERIDSAIDNVTQRTKGSIFYLGQPLIDLIAPDVKATNIVLSPAMDNSMAPTIAKGDLLCIVRTTTFDDEPNSIWYTRVNGRPFVRRVRKSGDDYILSADNPASPSFTVKASEMTFEFKVIWQGRSLSM